MPEPRGPLDTPHMLREPFVNPLLAVAALPGAHAYPLHSPSLGLPPAASASGSLADLVRLMGVAPHDGAGASQAARIPLRRLDEGSTLFLEGSRAHALYVLRCGSTKAVTVQEDGYEQVLAFQHSGDVLGFEGLYGALLPASAVALEDSNVYVLPLAELPHLREACPVFTQALELAVSRQLLNAAATVGLMASVASEARLARFLLWWSARMAAVGRSTRSLHLRMCRRDIASFLGLAHATVSRSFTALAEAGCLRVDNRDVELLDFDMLRARARTTRGAPGEAADALHDGIVAHHAPLAWPAAA